MPTHVRHSLVLLDQGYLNVLYKNCVERKPSNAGTFGALLPPPDACVAASAWRPVGNIGLAAVLKTLARPNLAFRVPKAYQNTIWRWRAFEVARIAIHGGERSVAAVVQQWTTINAGGAGGRVRFVKNEVFDRWIN